MPAMDSHRAASYGLTLRHALAANVRRLRSARCWSQEALAFESARLAVALEVTAAALLEMPPPDGDGGHTRG